MIVYLVEVEGEPRYASKRFREAYASYSRRRKSGQNVEMCKMEIPVNEDSIVKLVSGGGYAQSIEWWDDDKRGWT